MMPAPISSTSSGIEDTAAQQATQGSDDKSSSIGTCNSNLKIKATINWQ